MDTDLRASVRLRDGARPSVEWLVGIYRFFDQFETPRPSQVKAKIHGLITRVDALLANFRGGMWDLFFVLANDDRTMSGTGKFGQTPRLDTYRLIEQRFAELEMLRHLLVVAQDRIARATPGPSFAAKNVRDLVRGLGKVVEEYSDCRFQRSPAVVAFVEAVCQVADPKIGSGSIDEAMRRVVKMRKNHGAQRHHGAVDTQKIDNSVFAIPRVAGKLRRIPRITP
jgi:hypothetical protein